MKNCGDDPDVLKDMIDNIVCHYIVSWIVNVDLFVTANFRVTILGVTTIHHAKLWTTLQARRS